jgi:Membrane domain of glycerophosphoryl diester phosphodiesterase
MTLDLRPLTLGELLDRSFSLYRQHFVLFVGVMAIPAVFTLLLGVSLQVFPSVLKGQRIDNAADPATMGGMFAFGAMGFVVLTFAYWIAYMISLGATTVAVSELYVGRTASIASAYAQVRGHIGRLLVLLLLVGLLLLVLFVVLTMLAVVGALLATLISQPLGALVLLPGVFATMLVCCVCALRLALSVPTLVLEHVKVTEAIRRSVMLTQGNFWRTAVLVIFATIINWAAMALFQGPFFIAAKVAGPESGALIWLNVAAAVMGAIGSAICGPLMIIALALLYYDVRIRKEGLDLQIMIDSLEPRPGSAIPAPGL